MFTESAIISGSRFNGSQSVLAAIDRVFPASVHSVFRAGLLCMFPKDIEMVILEFAHWRRTPVFFAVLLRNVYDYQYGSSPDQFLSSLVQSSEDADRKVALLWSDGLTRKKGDWCVTKHSSAPLLAADILCGCATTKSGYCKFKGKQWVLPTGGRVPLFELIGDNALLVYEYLNDNFHRTVVPLQYQLGGDILGTSCCGTMCHISSWSRVTYLNEYPGVLEELIKKYVTRFLPSLLPILPILFTDPGGFINLIDVYLMNGSNVPAEVSTKALKLGTHMCRMSEYRKCVLQFFNSMSEEDLISASWSKCVVC